MFMWNSFVLEVPKVEEVLQFCSFVLAIVEEEVV